MAASLFTRSPQLRSGTGAALGDAAAILGAGQSDRVAQHPQQRGVGVDIDLMGLSIHAEISHLQTSLHRRWGGDD